MARIKNLQTGEIQHLLPYHRIGRLEASVDTYFPLPEVSNVHAVISWRWHEEKNSYAWFIKEDSTNGSWLEKKKLAPNQDVPLASGQVLALSSSDNPLLQILDISPPQPLLVNTSHELVLDLKAYNLVPTETPEWVLWKDSDEQQWRIKPYSVETITQNNKGAPLAHGEIVPCKLQQWRAFLPVVVTPTTALARRINSLRQVNIVLRVSRDEEHVDVSLGSDGEQISLGEKAYFGLLVYLVRKKMADANHAQAGQIQNTKNALSLAEQGWVNNELIQRELGLSESHLNIHVHRLRECFAAELDCIIEQEYLIERRRGAMRVGLDVSRISVEGGLIIPTEKSA